MDSSEEKTEDPTPYRLAEARKKGQVCKSQDVTAAVVFIAGLMFFSMFGPKMFYSLGGWARRQVLSMGAKDVTPGNVFRLIGQSAYTPLILVAQVFAVIAVAGVLGHLVQTGFLSSLQPLAPKLERLNPSEGIKKLISERGFLETLKVIIRTLLIIAVFRSFLLGGFLRITTAHRLVSGKLLPFYGSTALSLFYRMTLLIGVMAGLDYLLQRYLFMKQMRMTRQELKEEMKSLDGDPFIKSRMRSRQRELAKKRMLSDVKKSKVVVTNPTHLAVALKFDESEDEVPIVVAKGKDYLAEQIKKIARENGVSVHENKPLARALFKEVKVGDEIPEDLYLVVAEVIAFIERLEAGLESRLKKWSRQ